MSRNTWTATSAALAAVWARRATDPVTPAATPSPSASAQFTTRETTTLRRVVPVLVVSATSGTRSVLPGAGRGVNDGHGLSDVCEADEGEQAQGGEQDG